MNTGRIRAVAIGGLLAVVLTLGACQGRRFMTADGTGNARPAPRRGAGGQVSLTDRDLATVDAWLGTHNAQWILGDDVEIVASREYFAQYLTVNAAVGHVSREDSVSPAETTVTLTFLLPKGAESVTTNPRVLIGTGLTISARRRLIVRLVRTNDANDPVRLTVTATGEAVRGRKDEVTAREEQLRLGGRLVRGASGWNWAPLP